MAKIAVIGGGVVGISCALTLQDDGHDVTVLDHGAPGEGASWASCGSIAVSEVIPLSKPGTLMRAPGWLLDPTGPLTLRAKSAFQVLPWFWRFAANARMSRISKISNELSTLTRSALVDTEAVLARYSLRSLLHDTPVIEIYDTSEELIRERRFHNMRRALGFQIEEISGAEAVEREPSLAADFAGAVVFHDWRSVVDARRYVVALHEAFHSGGGTVLQSEATGFTRNGNTVTEVQTRSGRTVSADQVVVAAGAWSRHLVAELGLAIQMEGVIGYQTSLQDPGVELNHALIYAKGGFGITQYESGLAVRGSIEFADLDAHPNWKRAEILVEKAKRVLPGLRSKLAERRIGRRPLTSDTKPIIGRVPSTPNVILATGHGQLGLTLGATTGRLVRDIVAHRTPDIDISAFRLSDSKLRGARCAGLVLCNWLTCTARVRSAV